MVTAALCGVLSTGDDELSSGLVRLVEGKDACEVTVRYWPADAPADCATTPGCLAELAQREGLGLLVAAQLTDLEGEPWLQLGVFDREGERLLSSELPQGELAALALLVAKLQPAAPLEELPDDPLLPSVPRPELPEEEPVRGAMGLVAGVGRWYDPSFEGELWLQGLSRRGLGVSMSLGASASEVLPLEGPGRVRVLLPRATLGALYARRTGAWTLSSALEATVSLYASRPLVMAPGARLRLGAALRVAGPWSLSVEGTGGATFYPHVTPALALRGGPSLSW